MLQSWLHHTIPAIHLQHQTMHIGHQVFIYFVEVCGNDATQQETSKARRGVNGQHQIAQRQASRRRLGARVEDLHFCEKL